MKTKAKNNITPEEAIDFLESMRQISEERDELTKLISLRVPENILKTLKLKAKANHQKYQSLIIHYIRQGLRN